MKNNKVTKIKVQNIPCYSSIGIDAEEKKLGQRLLIDVELDTDSTKLVSSDNIKDTISYVDIHSTVKKFGESKPHSLIEVLAEEIAGSFLKHPLVQRAKIVVHKSHIPYPDFHGIVSVEVEREK